jgi:hypothetical protein
VDHLFDHLEALKTLFAAEDDFAAFEAEVSNYNFDAALEHLGHRARTLGIALQEQPS